MSSTPRPQNRFTGEVSAFAQASGTGGVIITASNAAGEGKLVLSQVAVGPPRRSAVGPFEREALRRPRIKLAPETRPTSAHSSLGRVGQSVHAENRVVEVGVLDAPGDHVRRQGALADPHNSIQVALERHGRGRDPGRAHAGRGLGGDPEGFTRFPRAEGGARTALPIASASAYGTTLTTNSPVSSILRTVSFLRPSRWLTGTIRSVGGFAVTPWKKLKGARLVRPSAERVETQATGLGIIDEVMSA